MHFHLDLAFAAFSPQKFTLKILYQFLLDSDVPVKGRNVKEMGSALTIGCAETIHRDTKLRDSLQEHGPFMFESAWVFGI